MSDLNPEKGQTPRPGDRFSEEEKFRNSPEARSLAQLGEKTWHDLNNLLTIVVGNAEQIADETNGSEVAEMASAIMEAAERCAVLNHRLLTISRRWNLMPETLEIDAFVALLLPTLNEELDGRALLETDLDAGVAHSKVDKIVLEATILELLSEAARMTPQGGRVRISTGKIEIDGTAYVGIALSDGATSLSPEQRRMAMDEVDTGGAAASPAAAILSAARNFTRRSGGDIRIEQGKQGVSVALLLPECPTCQA